MDMGSDDLRLTLRRFQCELVRSSEESFARLLTENPVLRVGFSNDGSYTDGRRIFLDPSMSDAYRYRAGLIEAERSIGAEEGSFSNDPVRTLHTITRALNIHECLHVIYTRFPIISTRETRANTDNGRRILSCILNIIEDYYIEMAGCAVYDNMSTYLRFLRTAIGFASAAKIGDVQQRNPRVLTFLNHMIRCILYPMAPVDDPPKWMEPYITSTKDLFNKGCTSHDPDTRYHCACAIYDAILDLIPENRISEEVMDRNLCNGTDPGTGSSERYSSGGKDIPEGPEPPEPLDGDGRPASGNKGPIRDDTDGLGTVEDDIDRTEQLMRRHEELHVPHVCVIPSDDYPGPHSHKGLSVRETILETLPETMSRYEALRRRVSLDIASLDRRLKCAISSKDVDTERKLLLGSAIDSRRLYDHKKRYWKRRIEEDAVPDIAVMLLIDGSGSMEEHRGSTIDACICIHEVLSMNDITHAIAEHRANGTSTIEVNVLKDFDGNPMQKTNIMRSKCHGVNRDGLALLWAEKRLSNIGTDPDARLIVIVSDGLPNHEHAGIPYNGESARKDVSDIVHRMHHSGTEVIAIALDNTKHELSSHLSGMYTNVISCDDTSQLPRKLVDILCRTFAGFS